MVSLKHVLEATGGADSSCTGNRTCLIYSVTGAVHYLGAADQLGIGIIGFFVLLWVVMVSTAMIMFSFNPSWSRMYASVPYFTSLRSFVLFFLLVTAGFCCVIQFSAGCINEDWEALGTAVGIFAALLGLRFLHWLMHSPSRLMWFLGLSLPTATFMLSAIYSQIEEISRQGKVAYYGYREPVQSDYKRAVTTSALQFALTACVALVCFLASFWMLFQTAYNFKFVTKFRQLMNVQRATFVMSVNCMLTGFVLAVASGFQSISGFQPNQPSTREMLFLLFKWWCIIFIGSSSICPLFFAILERSSRLQSVIKGLITAVFLSLCLNTLSLSALGVASGDL